MLSKELKSPLILLLLLFLLLSDSGDSSNEDLFEDAVEYLWKRSFTSLPADPKRESLPSMALLERLSYDLEKWFRYKCLLLVLSANGWKDQNMDSSFSRQEIPNMAKTLFNWPIVLQWLQYDVKAKYRLISRKFSGRTFYHLTVRLTNQKPRAFVSVR